jgi:hypothetical protein
VPQTEVQRLALQYSNLSRQQRLTVRPQGPASSLDHRQAHSRLRSLTMRGTLTRHPTVNLGQVIILVDHVRIVTSERSGKRSTHGARCRSGGLRPEQASHHEITQSDSTAVAQCAFTVTIERCAWQLARETSALIV